MKEQNIEKEGFGLIGAYNIGGRYFYLQM